jgi:TonB family protein
MKYLYAALFLTFTLPQINMIAQDTVAIDMQVVEENLVTEEQSTKDQGVWFVEEDATFQGGGIPDFSSWILKHTQYPEEAAKEKIIGKVMIQFSIDTQGKVCDVIVIRSVHPLLDSEAIRVIKSSPDWKPAKQSGREVKQNFVIPVVFSLN